MVSIFSSLLGTSFSLKYLILVLLWKLLIQCCLIYFKLVFDFFVWFLLFMMVTIKVRWIGSAIVETNDATVRYPLITERKFKLKTKHLRTITCLPIYLLIFSLSWFSAKNNLVFQWHVQF